MVSYSITVNLIISSIWVFRIPKDLMFHFPEHHFQPWAEMSTFSPFSPKIAKSTIFAKFAENEGHPIISTKGTVSEVHEMIWDALQPAINDILSD